MKKIFSLFAAVLFAGSMMAGEVTVSKTIHDLFPDDANGTQEATLYSDANLSISVNPDGNNGKVYGTGTEWRLYQTNSAVVTVQATNATIKTVAFEFTVKNTGILKFGDNVMESGTAVNVNAASAQFVVANSGAATNGQVIIKGFTVVYETAGDTPQEDTYTVAGEPTTVFGTTWDLTNTANDMAKQTDGSYKWEKTGLELGAGTVAFKVVKNRDWNNGANAWPAENYNLAIAEAGIYTITITFEPENENAVKATATKTGEAVVVPTVVMHGTFVSSDWADTEAFAKAEDKKTASLKLTLAAGDIEFGLKLDGAWKANGATITRENASTSLASGEGNMHLTADVDGEYTFTYTYETQTLEVTFPKIITVMTCAEAAEAAATAGDEIYKAKGYVTEIAYALSNGSMSFWMADTEDGGRVLEAYKCAVADEADAPKVGDLVIVTGQLTVYQSTKEFKQGCTVEIVERAAEPVNLGEKTIAEFLALKNTKDTCVLTGKVIEIVNDQYGNLTIEDATGSLYVYGVLTPAGESKKFSTLDVAVNDVLTIKATYTEYNDNPQAKNAIFVSREKATPSAIDNATVATKAQKMIIDGQLFIIRDGVMFNANGAAVK